MKCPHCGKQTKIPERAFGNVDTYGGSVIVVTECCGKAVWLYQERTYGVTPYTGDKNIDDWGEKIKTWTQK